MCIRDSYYILAHVGLFGGKENPTVAYMDGWFHYFKLYAATIGCVGFMMIKYKWGIGKEKWFKWFPWFIVAANIMIANVSDLESAFAALKISGNLSGAWWASNEGVFLYGGWWNILNALAGLINIFCMTGCIHLFTSKDKSKSDMLWPDMTIWFIVAYDIWNFEYTYLEFVLPVMKRYFPEALGGVSPAEFFLAVNRAEPSMKRTEADELTYCLHIMIRYELEKALVSGDISACDVPKEWGRLCGEYLGLVPETDAEGCLQDMHWGSGLIGYFPTYALGNAYGAQIYHALSGEKDADAAVSRGEIPSITSWLAGRIHRFGALKTPAELIRSASGEDFDPRYYTDYLTKKFSALYGL